MWLVMSRWSWPLHLVLGGGEEGGAEGGGEKDSRSKRIRFSRPLLPEWDWTEQPPISSRL